MIACMVAVGAFSAHAGTILFDNTGATGGGADPISAGEIYASFSTGSNSGVLGSLELILVASNPNDEGTISVGLYADNSTTPGSEIVSLGTIADSSLSTTPGLFPVTLSSNPTLSSNTRYWIGLSTSGTGKWEWSSNLSGTGVSGEYFYNYNLETLSNSSQGFAYQMQVVMDPSSVPEPSTLLSGASGLIALGISLAVARFHKRRT